MRSTCKATNSHFFVTMTLAALVFTVGCGSGNDPIFGGGEATNVDEIQAEDGVIGVGEGTVVRFDFSFDTNEVLSDDGDVQLVVRLPRGLRFRPDSAEIDGFGSDDKSVGAQVLECRDSGESYLLFNMDRFDLRNAQSPGNSDARLTLTVDGTKRSSSLVVEAKADDNRVAYGCDLTFIPDEQEVIAVI
jgi:hypothetical protein